MQPRRSKNGFLMVPRAQGISKEHRPWSVPLHCSTVERDQVGPVMGSEYGLRIWLMLKRIFLFPKRSQFLPLASLAHAQAHVGLPQKPMAALNPPLGEAGQHNLCAPGCTDTQRCFVEALLS